MVLMVLVVKEKCENEIKRPSRIESNTGLHIIFKSQLEGQEADMDQKFRLSLLLSGPFYL